MCKTKQTTLCACTVPPVLPLGLGSIVVWEVLIVFECMLVKVVEVIEPELVAPEEAW